MTKWILIAALGFSSTSWATGKPDPVDADTQAQSQMQNANQANTQSVVAGGGQGGGASNQLNMGGDRSTTVAIGNTAPIPLHDVPACYLPAKGIKRIRRVLFGVVDFDPRLVRDEACYADLVARRAHELALIEAQARLELARAERIKAENAKGCEVQTERVLRECAAK